jgi:hypothetical protein
MVGITLVYQLITKESQTTVLETLLIFTAVVQPCSLKEQFEHVQSTLGCRQCTLGFMNLRMSALTPS